MEEVTVWLVMNWEYVLLGLWLSEKIVKLTPWPYDDIVVDMIGQTLKRLFKIGKKPKPEV